MSPIIIEIFIGPDELDYVETKICNMTKKDLKNREQGLYCQLSKHINYCQQTCGIGAQEQINGTRQSSVWSHEYVKLYFMLSKAL